MRTRITLAALLVGLTACAGTGWSRPRAAVDWSDVGVERLTVAKCEAGFIFDAHVGNYHDCLDKAVDAPKRPAAAPAGR